MRDFGRTLYPTLINHIYLMTQSSHPRVLKKEYQWGFLKMLLGVEENHAWTPSS